MLRELFTIALVGTVLVAGGAGGWLVAGGPLQGTASAPVTVDAGTAAEHGFEEPTAEQIAFDERVAVQGVEKRIDVAAYVMTATNPDAGAAVTTISLPGWTVGGVSLNPLTYVPLKQAVTHILPNLPMETPEVRYEDESTVAFAGENVTAGEYAVEGEGPRLVVARRTMGGDTVFGVGLYDPSAPESRDAVDALFADLSHG
ncbi:DUF6517 family protein [Halolamina salifodinae]|uniref:Uncharacterized protein n=1 Tax=Halolamina salifodinae TaxID=1202767 RepID=A0A8T4GWM3_9EURY|nr:DUF6517 family protein [Halolamina salifodinae]MBP1987299.1 hypothetical protein [Halolamina salifodinae]